MKRKLSLIALISPVILILDQWTKWLIVEKIPFGGQIVVWEHFFDLVHARNTGAAFGVLSQWDSSYRNVFFYVLAFLAISFLFYFLKQLPSEKKWAPLPIGLIFGGALGNILDRIFRGSVVDFLSFHWYNHHVSWEIFSFPIDFYLIWPAFNVADSAITVGVIWLLCLVGLKESLNNQETRLK